uniref:Pentatricopeptide repeat-containing protein n=1 Tax=Arundo donax TaxID=35708 RepID=A0A0A9AIX4_ARUDO
MYAKTGLLRDARTVFNAMQVLANNLVPCYQVCYTFASVVRACMSSRRVWLPCMLSLDVMRE